MSFSFNYWIIVGWNRLLNHRTMFGFECWLRRCAKYIVNQIEINEDITNLVSAGTTVKHIRRHVLQTSRCHPGSGDKSAWPSNIERMLYYMYSALTESLKHILDLLLNSENLSLTSIFSCESENCFKRAHCFLWLINTRWNMC